MTGSRGNTGTTVIDHDEAITALFDRRVPPTKALAEDADAIARVCLAMAGRFHQGGKLIIFGNGGTSTDARQVAVEFVHPVIVGKPALPAISLTADVATVTGVSTSVGVAEVFAHQIRCLGERSDIAMGVSTEGNCPNVAHALHVARNREMLTIALVGNDGGKIESSRAADHVFIARSGDPRVIKEVHVTTYHLLWELVHIFLGQPRVVRHEAIA